MENNKKNIIIKFISNDINSIITLRTSKNPDFNIYGKRTYTTKYNKIDKYTWEFELDKKEYPNGIEFKFLLNNTHWQIRSNRIEFPYKQEKPYKFKKDEIIFNIEKEKEFDDFLKIYNIYYDHIKHENSLQNQRIGFFIASQSFVFIEYFNILSKYYKNCYNNYDLISVLLICFLGFLISSLVAPIFEAENNALSTINTIWRKQYLDKNSSIFKSIQAYQSPEENEIKPIRGSLKKESRICFLEIDNKKIPNISYENANKALDTSLAYLFNKIPCWFMGIWIVLFLWALLSKDIFS